MTYELKTRLPTPEEVDEHIRVGRELRAQAMSGLFSSLNFGMRRKSAQAEDAPRATPSHRTRQATA